MSSGIECTTAMLRGRRVRRRVAWVASLALLLNAATPLLASAAAALRGVPVGEICEVWGVTLPAGHHAIPMAAAPAGDAMAMDGHPSAMPAMDGMATADARADATADPHAAHHAHGGAHCGLTSLATFAPPGLAPLPAVTATAAVAAVPALHATTTAFDAVAHWASRNKQGPPVTREA